MSQKFSNKNNVSRTSNVILNPAFLIKFDMHVNLSCVQLDKLKMMSNWWEARNLKQKWTIISGHW